MQFYGFIPLLLVTVLWFNYPALSPPFVATRAMALPIIVCRPFYEITTTPGLNELYK